MFVQLLVSKFKIQFYLLVSLIRMIRREKKHLKNKSLSTAIILFQGLCFPHFWGLLLYKSVPITINLIIFSLFMVLVCWEFSYGSICIMQRRAMMEPQVELKIIINNKILIKLFYVYFVQFIFLIFLFKFFKIIFISYIK